MRYVALAFVCVACGGQVERDPPGDVELLKLSVRGACEFPEVKLRVDYRNSTAVPATWMLADARLDFGGKWVWLLPLAPSTSGVIEPGERVTMEHFSVGGDGPLKVNDMCYDFCGRHWTLQTTWSTADGRTEERTESGKIRCTK